MEKSRLTGIILSGGKSSRMGSEKGLILFKGKPMIEYSVSILTQLCDEIIICANNSNYDYLGFKVVSDIITDCGPLGGLYTGLSESNSQYNLIAPCDVPFITKDLYILLLQNIANNNAVIPSYNNEIHPLCGIYSLKCISVLQSLISEKKFKMLRVVDELGAKIVPLKYDTDIFININTLEELIKLKD